MLQAYDEGRLPATHEQTWDGEALYPTIESRASHLLYFVIKDHPLSDGNKRTGTNQKGTTKVVTRIVPMNVLDGSLKPGDPMLNQLSIKG